MRIFRNIVGLGLLAATATCSTVLGGPRMREPMIYVIDYGEQFLRNEMAIQAYADAPPDLMHVGKSVPILHNWGPVPLLSGENQFTGGPNHTLNRDAIRLLTPAELAARIDMLKSYTKKWHDIGVPVVLPYSSMQTIAGDHEKREGFWMFYDHWADYEKWLGPKPANDPFTWQMFDAKGQFLGGDNGGYAPAYFAPLHRYRVCPENPDWRKFQSRLTQLIAEVGYDGVFPDNSNPTNACFCKHCQEGLKEYAKKLTPRELSVLGVNGDPAQMSLLAKGTPSELIRRYRIDTSARWQRMIREAGRAVNPKFIVFPNVNSYRSFMPMSDSCDVLMFESVYSPGRSISGPLPEDPFVVIEAGTVATQAPRGSYRLHVQNAATFVEFAATLDYPISTRAVEPAELTAHIEAVGGSATDNDWAEDFRFLLTDMKTGKEEAIVLAPKMAVGSERAPGGRRPPVTLKGQWTPPAAGRYRLSFSYRYTDPDHLDVTTNLVCRHELTFAQLFQTHIGQLMYTMYSPARTVLLDYVSRAKGAENVQELGLAECAAFSNGSALASAGEPQKKYARFFRRSSHLYKDFEPYGDIGVVYSYWGHNPDGMGLAPDAEVSPANDLAGHHRLIKVLMDRTLDESDLRSVKSLVLFGTELEMSDTQVAILKDFVARGGKLLLCKRGTTLNGKLLRETLGDVSLWEAGMDMPGMPPVVKPTGENRGLRLSAFVKSDERKMTLHAVNYNVSLQSKPATVVPTSALSATLTLPPGRVVNAAKVYDPDRQDAGPLDFRQDGRTLTFTMPPVRIYAIVEITMD
jgi:hypothetical protein